MRPDDGTVGTTATRYSLTFFGAHKTVGHQHKAVGTGARDFRRLAIDLRRRQTQVGTMAVDGGAMVHAVRLPVRVVHVHHHRVLSLHREMAKRVRRLLNGAVQPAA